MDGQSNEERILRKLDQILRVVSMALTNGLKQKEQIMLLDRAAFQPKEIAELLGTTSNTVSKELSVSRKRASQSGGPRREKKKHS